MVTKLILQPFSRLKVLFTPFVRRYFKARTLLEPFRRLHYPIAVCIRTQVPMSTYPGNGKVLFQGPDQGPQGKLLFLSPRIGGMSLLIQSTFIGDAYAILVVSPGMGTYLFQRPGTPDIAILADVEVITHTGHSPGPMTTEQVFLRKIYIHPGSGAMHHN